MNKFQELTEEQLTMVAGGAYDIYIDQKNSSWVKQSIKDGEAESGDANGGDKNGNFVKTKKGDNISGNGGYTSATVGNYSSVYQTNAIIKW